MFVSCMNEYLSNKVINALVDVIDIHSIIISAYNNLIVKI